MIWKTTSQVFQVFSVIPIYMDVRCRKNRKPHTLLFQVYTGRYIPPQQRANPVLTEENCLAEITVGTFVAVHIDNWDKVPVIGNVVEVKEETIKVHYWQGSFKGKFRPQNVPRSCSPWVDELPKTCVILCSFSLSDENKLLPSTRKYLQEEYVRLKNQNAALTNDG